MVRRVQEGQDQPEGGLVRVERHRQRSEHQLWSRESHLRNQPVDLRSGAQSVLLPSLLRGAAGSELPKPGSGRRHPERGALLVGPRRGRLPLRRDRAARGVRDGLRHGARDGGLHQEAPQSAGGVSRSRDGRGEQQLRQLRFLLGQRVGHVPHGLRFRLWLLLGRAVRRHQRGAHPRALPEGAGHLSCGRPGRPGYRLPRRAQGLRHGQRHRISLAARRVDPDDDARHAVRLLRRRARPPSRQGLRRGLT